MGRPLIMDSIDRDTLLLVGVCGPAHGVRGEVKVIPETDDPARLLDLERVWLGMTAGDATVHGVERARFQTTKKGLTVLLQLSGIASREAADMLRRQRVYAAPTDLPESENGQHFLHDLHGLDVYVETASGDDQKIGVVADVIEGVAQDLIVVQRPGMPDALVPDVTEIVVNVDFERNALTLRPPEGLLD